MKLDVVMAGNKMEIEYDEIAKEALIKAGIYSALRLAIDQERIADLEETIRKQEQKIARLEETLENVLPG